MGRNLRRLPVKPDPNDHGYDAFPISGDLDRSNRWVAYCLGWKHGATGRAIDESASKHSDQGIAAAYNVAYKVGSKAFSEAARGASLLFGYTPTILR